MPDEQRPSAEDIHAQQLPYPARQSDVVPPFGQVSRQSGKKPAKLKHSDPLGHGFVFLYL